MLPPPPPPTHPPPPPPPNHHPLQAFEKNPKDADTLANLIAVSLHLGKAAARYQSQLKLVAPEHAIVRRSEEGEAAFDRAATAVTA